MLVCLPLWFISIVAETRRAPLDLAEGERELIRGLNIELSSALLAFVLVGEYGLLVAFSWFTRTMFLIGLISSFILVVLSILFIRRVLPRYRYDKLMALCWTKILPLALLWTTFILCLSSL